MRTRAQSQIITTILLILIVLAAVIVVWMIIDRFLFWAVPTVGCGEVRASIESVDQAANTVKVKRSGGSGLNVTGIRVVFGEEVKDVEGTGGAPQELAVYTTTAFTGDIQSGSVIEAAIIITSPEGREYICDPTDKVVVS